MKFRLLTLLLVSALTLNIACKKEEEPIPPIPFFDVNLVITPYPANGANNLSFLTTPFLAFNKQFDLDYFDSYNNDLVFAKLVFDSTYIVNSNYQKVNTTPTFNTRKDTLRFTSAESFSADSSYTIKLHYHIEAKREPKDKYEILQQDGAPFAGIFESSFTIKKYNTSIDTSSIEYAYPWPYQYHFLKNETTRGVIKFKENQDFDLYYKDASFKVKFSNLNGQSWINNANYSKNERKLIFQIPSNNLDNQTIYKVDFILNNNNENDNTFLTYYFRTSKFNTFEEKISTTYDINDTKIHPYNDMQFILIKYFKLNEAIDIAEGKAFYGLMKFKAYGNESGGWINKIYDYPLMHLKNLFIPHLMRNRAGEFTVGNP